MALDAVATAVEKVRAAFRPEEISVLFVGESAPAGGTFFYNANSQVYRELSKALDRHLVGDGAFLERFKAAGFFVDDLVPAPINWSTPAERRARHRANVGGLAGRITVARPQLVVSLLLAIAPSVQTACDLSRTGVVHKAVPFPGTGQQGRFRAAMAELVPELLTLSKL